MLGLCLIILTSATTASVMVIQPIKPKHTIVEDFRTYYGLEQEMKSFINKKIKEGYIVKSVSMMDDESWSKGIVVMEKY